MPHSLRFLVAIVLAGSATAASAQTRLEWKFKEQGPFQVETVQQLRFVLKTATEEVQQTLTQTTVLRLAFVARNPDQSTTLEARIESLDFKYASDDPAADEQVAQQLQGLGQSMQGAAFRVVLSPRLEVLKLEGFDEWLRQARQEGLATPKAAPFSIDGEFVKRLFREVVLGLPDRPVKFGDQWDRKWDLALGPLGQVAVTSPCKYEGQDFLGGRLVEKIGLGGTVTHQPALFKEKLLPVEVSQILLKGEECQGSVHFDATAGKLVQSQIQLRLKGTALVSCPGRNLRPGPVPGGLSPVEIHQEYSRRTRLLVSNPALR